MKTDLAGRERWSYKLRNLHVVEIIEVTTGVWTGFMRNIWLEYNYGIFRLG